MATKITLFERLGDFVAELKDDDKVEIHEFEFTDFEDFLTEFSSLDYRERDLVLDKLVALRRIYGDFFVIPERVFDLMRSQNCRDVTDNCLQGAIALAEQGLQGI